MEVKPVVSNLDGQNAWLQVTYPLNHPLKHFFFLFKVFLNERIGREIAKLLFCLRHEICLDIITSFYLWESLYRVL